LETKEFEKYVEQVPHFAFKIFLKFLPGSGDKKSWQ